MDSPDLKREETESGSPLTTGSYQIPVERCRQAGWDLLRSGLGSFLCFSLGFAFALALGFGASLQFQTCKQFSELHECC